jgi:hypothetical protein
MDDKLKKFRRFSLFFTVQLIGFGILLVSMGILFSRDANGDMSLTGIIMAVLAGLSWHAASISYGSAREMKKFTDLDSYMKYVESKGKDKTN